MPKVLLVEDNEMNRDMLTRRLVRKGFEVIAAPDGLEGLSMAESQCPDVILMDICLPGLDGTEAAIRLKNNRRTCRIPLIALTAHAMASDKERALASGFDDYDTKPIDLPRLIGKIEANLAARTVGPALADEGNNA